MISGGGGDGVPGCTSNEFSAKSAEKMPLRYIIILPCSESITLNTSACSPLLASIYTK